VTELNLSLEDLYSGITKKMRVTRKIVCKTCAGKGGTSGKTYTCDTCDGKGVRVYAERGPGFLTQRHAPCNKCEGKGESIPDSEKCKTCHGDKVVEDQKILKVEIDKGSKEGKRIVFRGESDELPGVQAGDLIFVVKQKPHNLFKRDGSHLILEQQIPLISALTGAKFTITHLNGRKLTIKSKDGEIIKPGDVREIPNEGMPIDSRPYEHGNLYIKFSVAFPDKLTRKQVDAVAKAMPKPPPIEAGDAEMVELKPVDPAKLKQEAYESSNTGEAYEEDERNPRTTSCAQQ